MPRTPPRRVRPLRRAPYISVSCTGMCRVTKKFRSPDVKIQRKTLDTFHPRDLRRRCAGTEYYVWVFQKNPRVRKIRVRNSGGGNGCANFMDARKKCVLSAGKTMSIKFLVLGGGGILGLGGGRECRFYFDVLARNIMSGFCIF